MPRKTSFVPNVTGTQLIPLDEIPDDIKQWAEEVYEKIRKTDGRERAAYDNDDEMNLEAKYLASYCAQRPHGALKFRRSPTKDLPAHTMDFRITADVEANGKRQAENGDTGTRKAR